MSFTQDLFSSRRNYNDGNVRIGEQGRLWYDSITNTLRVNNGFPGGLVVGTNGTVTGDIGPVNSIVFTLGGPGVTPVPGMITYNPAEDCFDAYQQDGTVLQLGLENYIDVANNSASLLENGTCVRFGGVDGNEFPIATPLIADGTVPPLYIIGILTEDIPAGAHGRATILGKVRDLNTTGSDVGETWAQGTLLWAHPTLSGKLTSVQPSAPNIVVSVAAVLKVGATDGIILVRPTIFPRLYYGSFYSTQAQFANVTSTPYAVTLTNTDIASGFVLENNSHIKALNSGLYNFQFSLQVNSTSSSTSAMWIWYRLNGNNAPYSATKITTESNKAVTAPAWNFLVRMQTDDYFQLMWAVDNSNLHLDAPAATSFAPATPSVILTVNQVNL